MDLDILELERWADEGGNNHSHSEDVPEKEDL